MGGGEKCKTCGKSVYEAERLIVEEKNSRSVYHKGCFRCQEEGCTVILDLRNYGSINGLVYCKPHLKEANERDRAQSSASTSSGPSKFLGRLGGGDCCKVCEKRVYESEKMIVENRGERDVFHKSCFNCQYEGCSVKLDLRNYGSHADKIYCRTHLKEVSKDYVAKNTDEKVEAPSAVAEKFKNLGGGGDKCAICDKGVYHLEKLTVEDTGSKVSHYHKACFKCSVCKKELDLSTYGSNFGIIYCLTHLKTHGKAQQAKQDVFISPLAQQTGGTQQRENPDIQDDEEPRNEESRNQDEESNSHEEHRDDKYQEENREEENQEEEKQERQEEDNQEEEKQEDVDPEEDEEMRERRRKRQEREEKRKQEEEEEERELDRKKKEREDRRKRLEEEEE